MEAGFDGEWSGRILLPHIRERFPEEVQMWNLNSEQSAGQREAGRAQARVAALSMA